MFWFKKIEKLTPVQEFVLDLYYFKHNKTLDQQWEYFLHYYIKE